MDLTSIQGGTTSAAGSTFNAGTIASVGQGIQQIIAANAAADQEEKNADILRELGLVNAREEREFNKSVMAAQINASGPGGATGSQLDVLLSDAVKGEVAALRRAFGFDAAAAVAETRADNTRLAGAITGVGTILGGFQRSFGQNPATREPGSGFDPLDGPPPTPASISRAQRIGRVA